ncbi:conserved domain protein [Parvimonas sp. oral taxon 393 str. F0440]|nr:conserved domain protein [Parvimonas sp. oral taxon 393 str. F0440]
MKKIAITILISIILVSCSNKNNEENKVVKQLQEQKDSLEKKNNELQEKNDSLEKENKELKEKIKNSENNTLNSESVAKINKYLQEFNNSNKHFAKTTFDEKNNTVNIELVEQAASDVSGLIDYNDKGMMTKPMLEGWQNEIVDTALLISKNLDKSITVKILQPTDKTKTIVEVKAGKVIKDIMK